MKKKITVTEADIREALGPVTAYSPLGNDLVWKLFGSRHKPTPFETRLANLEKRVERLSKRKSK